MKRKIALIFDIDDTLYSQMEPVVSACEESLGYPLPDAEAFYRVFCKWNHATFHDCESGKMSMEESRFYRITNTMRELGIAFTDETAKRFQKRYQEKQSRLSVSQTMAALLDDCRARQAALGVITNGPQEHQMRKFRTMRLDRWFSEACVLVSGAAGAAKPDERIFRLEEERMGLWDSEIYMIGDSYENDILGAMGVGWKTIWMNHHRHPVPEGVQPPDHIAYTEKELADTILQILE